MRDIGYGAGHRAADEEAVAADHTSSVGDPYVRCGAGCPCGLRAVPVKSIPN